MPRKKSEPQNHEKLSIEEIIEETRKEMGEDIVKLYSDRFKGISRTTSGITALDLILGGGWPDGRIIEIYGPESSGKTTIALHAIAAAQKEGKTCAYIDAEHAYDPVYAGQVGVDTDHLLFAEPLGGEKALQLIDVLVRTGSVDLIVIDSVAALVPQKELDGDFGDANVGLHARLMSQAMRKLTGPAKAMNCTLIFINQIREKVGVMFGSPETTTGGRALKFYSSIRLDVRKREALKDGNEVYANRTRVKTVKNKTFPPMKVAEFDIEFGKGVDNVGSVVDLAVDFGLMAKGGGGYYTYKEHRVRGRSAMIDFLKSDEGKVIFSELEQDVKHLVSQNSAEIMSLSAEEMEATKKALNEEESADDSISK